MDIKAVQDVLIIGDSLVDSIYHSYSKLKREAEMAKPSPCRGPYVLDYYNVSCKVMGSINGITSTAARIQNCLIHLLNHCKTLPRFIIVIPDNDILKHCTVDIFDYGAKLVCEEIVAWMVNELDRAVESRKEDMKRLKKGSVLAAEPKFIYAKMIY